MTGPAVFSEVRSSIPAIEKSRLENLGGKSYEELLALVPELNVMELRNERAAPPRSEIDVLCWNGERGRFVVERTALPPADVYLLNEMDAGMARTENAHTVRELAERLELNYLFAVEFLELTKGEQGEREAPGENALGFHGNAILTRWPVLNPRLLRLEGGAQWLDDEQKRIGSRMALICSIQTASGPLRLVCTHLESESSPSLRARQMREIVSYLEPDDPDMPTVLGGDLNTWSFDKRDAGEQARLAQDPQTPARLLRPMAWEPLFEELTAHGYELEAMSDLSRGTYPVPGFPIEARLDWIVARGLRVTEASVFPAPHSGRRGRPVSDHHAVRVVIRA